MIEALISLRQELHQHPELSNQEINTAARIKQELKTTNPSQLIEQVGGHGILATYDSHREGKHILFRADMDALPIQEINELPYRSKIDGVSHKCGHDGHTTILIGLAKRLSESSIPSGKITLLFQPAEETGEGARAVLADPRFQQIKPDFIFALHNIPKYPKGSILCKSANFNPSVISFIVKLKGKEAHAAQPENGINPAIAIAMIIKELDKWNNSNLNAEEYLKTTVIHIDLGTKDYGMSASQAEIHYTIRCRNETSLEIAKSNIIHLINKISENQHLKFNIEWLHHFAACMNHPEAIKYIKKVASDHAYSYINMPVPFEWGEDFGLFTASIPGAMFGLGAGIDTPDLHQADYDFPDDILKHGINMFYGLAMEVC